MDAFEIEKMLIAEVTEILEMNGCLESPITPDIRPLDGLGGFESLNAVEAAVGLSRKLKLKIEVTDFGYSCKQKNFNMLSISEIAKNISKKISK